MSFPPPTRAYEGRLRRESRVTVISNAVRNLFPAADFSVAPLLRNDKKEKTAIPVQRLRRNFPYCHFEWNEKSCLNLTGIMQHFPTDRLCFSRKKTG
jgi:hypothetical protein